MSTPFEAIRAWAPIAIVAAGLVGTGYVTLDRQAVLAEEVEDIGDSVDENEEAIELIQRQLIQRQGEVELRTQRIEIEQQTQGDKLDEALMLLQQIVRDQ